MAVAAHAALLVFGRLGPRAPDESPRVRELALLVPAADHPEVEMRYRRPERDVGGPPRAGSRPVLPTLVPSRETPRTLPPLLAQLDTVRRTADPADADGPPGRLAPGLAEGRLWVRPLPLPPKELASRVSGLGHSELADSAVTAIVQAYLDSVALEPGARFATLPRWVTTIAGKEFGVDRNNLIIGGIKIPAAVLALLGLAPGLAGAGGSIDQAKAYQRVMDMREDILRSAARAESYEEFRQAIRELRERTEQEREFERNRRTVPPRLVPADSASR